MEGLKLRQEMAKKGKTIQDVANAIGKSRETALGISSLAR